MVAQEGNSIRTQFPGGVWVIFQNFRAICLALTDLLLVLAAFGLTFYLPAIVSSLEAGVSYTKAALLSVIPFTVGGLAMFLNGWHSDHTRERPCHVIVAAVTGASGFVLLVKTASPSVSIFALSLAVIGAYGYLSAFWAIPPAVLSGQAAPVGLAAINSVGNIGGFLGLYIGGVISGRPSSLQANQHSRDRKIAG